MPESHVAHYRWDTMPFEPVTDMISRRIITGEREMLAQIVLKKGAIVPEHAHEAEQLTYVLQGSMRFRIDGQPLVVAAGEVVLIPSQVPHQAEALEDVLELDVFSPIRHDWLNGTDDYFRR